jgi:CRP/FNR family transcriptional regulator, cyclic AMP receptor protein
MTDRHASLLDLDPDLGELMDDARHAAARHALIAVVHPLKPGPWDVERLRDAGPEHVGLLIVEGLLAREVVLSDNVSCELLGAGDLIRPWQFHAEQLLRAEVRWTVLDGGRVAVVDRRLGSQLAQYPEVNAMLIDRLCERAQRLAVSQAICQLNGVDRRLLALFWQLAERWGKVVADGVSVTLPLPHRLIAELVGARRPTVSTALGQLADRGLLTRDGETWLLHGDPVGVPTGEAARVIRGRRRRFAAREHGIAGGAPQAGVRQTVG